MEFGGDLENEGKVVVLLYFFFLIIKLLSNPNRHKLIICFQNWVIELSVES